MDRDLSYLLDIFEAAKLAISYVSNKTEQAFLSDIQCQDSVIRRFEIIGEAAKRVSESTRLDYPELPWNEMIGMRNLLIHEYDDVDMDILWKTVQIELPKLVKQLEAILD